MEIRSGLLPAGLFHADAELLADAPVELDGCLGGPIPFRGGLHFGHSCVSGRVTGLSWDGLVRADLGGSDQRRTGDRRFFERNRVRHCLSDLPALLLASAILRQGQGAM